MKHTLLILISFILILSQVYGTETFTDNLTIPHTFSSGETISSQKMNDNFNELLKILNRLKAINNVKNWADEIVILDSYSTDETVKIAKKNGAKVFFRKFDNFSNQRKYAFRELPINGEWIFVLDADEYLTNELKKEILSIIEHTQYDA